MKKHLTSYLALAAATVLVSCKKEDPKPDCGCDGPTMVVIKNARAVHQGAGLFTFKDPISNNPISAWACEADSAWPQSPNREVADYTISGNLKKECFFGPTFAIVFPGIDLTAVKKD